jgi:radical SAM superfamily enzyme with C-terminal helix-hairpin-helix motif
MSRKIPVWDSHKKRIEYRPPETINDFERYVIVDLSELPENCDINAVTYSGGKLRPISAAELKEKTDERLVKYKTQLYSQVDTEAKQRIASGSFSKHNFSISQNAQLKWTGLFNARDSLSYPVVVYNKDDSKTHKVKDAAAVADLYNELVSTVQSLLSKATAVKEDLKAAKDLNTAKEIVANYLSSE